MKLWVNGREREFEAAESLADLLRQLKIDPAVPGFAAALNGEVIPRPRLLTTPVKEGDRIEIVHAVQGG